MKQECTTWLCLSRILCKRSFYWQLHNCWKSVTVNLIGWLTEANWNNELMTARYWTYEIWKCLAGARWVTWWNQKVTFALAGILGLYDVFNVLPVGLLFCLRVVLLTFPETGLSLESHRNSLRIFCKLALHHILSYIDLDHRELYALG